MANITSINEPWDGHSYLEVENFIKSDIALLGKGDGDGSIEHRNEDSNQSVSAMSITMGGSNIAGLKVYYWKYINFSDYVIYLCEDATDVVSSEPEIDQSFVNPYAIGDTFSFRDNTKYYDCGQITAINHNAVVVSSLPESDYETTSGSKHLFFVIEKPQYGSFDYGVGAEAFGFNNKSLGVYSHVEGEENIAVGSQSHTEGYQSKSYGQQAHAEGYQTVAQGNASHAEGYITNATNKYCHTEGSQTIASGIAGHAEGESTRAVGQNSHAEGAGELYGGVRYGAAEGYAAHAEGKSNASGDYSHAEGYRTVASAEGAHVEGISQILDSIKYGVAAGKGSHVEGKSRSTESGTYAHAEGYQNTASGDSSHVEGYLNISSGDFSHAEGHNTLSEGTSSHAEGTGTKAYKLNSHAEGEGTKANGQGSHVEGYYSTVGSRVFGITNGKYSHAEGHSITESDATYSHTEGDGTRAKNKAEHAEGTYNISNNGGTTETNTRHSVGIGNATASKNAFEIMENGDIYALGVGGYDGTNATSDTTKTLAASINSSSMTVLSFSDAEFTNPTAEQKNILRSAYENNAISSILISSSNDQYYDLSPIISATRMGDAPYPDYMFVIYRAAYRGEGQAIWGFETINASFPDEPYA